MCKKKCVQVLTHGGDWAGYETEYGKAPLDFSMNVNPLGISQKVRQAITEAAQRADRYPDPLCRALTQRLAEYESVPREWIFCGNGAADIIFRMARALKPNVPAGSVRRTELTGALAEPTGSLADPARSLTVSAEALAEPAGLADSAEEARRPVLLITAPTFSEYEMAFKEQGWEIRRHLLKEEQGFRLSGPETDDQSEDILHAIGEDVDAVFLCEPNNPTGVTTDRQLLQKILERCEETGAMLVMDECFNGFLEDPRQHSMKDALGLRKGLIILKAFTKLYGMAGVRLGYCLCADEAVIRKLRGAGAPWNVSALAQAAGIAALEDQRHVEKGLAIVRRERPWLRQKLEELGAGRVYGEANYLLFRWPQEPAEEAAEEAAKEGALDQQLRRKGILIRNCANYPGLEQGWYRIAVRDHEENLQLIEALRQVAEDLTDPEPQGEAGTINGEER